MQWGFQSPILSRWFKIYKIEKITMMRQINQRNEIWMMQLIMHTCLGTSERCYSKQKELVIDAGTEVIDIMELSNYKN